MYPAEAFESEQFEFAFEDEAEVYGETGSPFTEAEEMELVLELLEVTNEAEMDYFLGKVFKKIGSGLKKISKPLGGILKGAAKQALPMLGKAAGAYFGGPAGAAIGGQLASKAGSLLGLELEGLSHEDQEYEVARQAVRVAGDDGSGCGALACGADGHRAVSGRGTTRIAQPHRLVHRVAQ